MMPLYQADDDHYLLLTKRTHLVEHHKGQISFPGGMRDPSDEDLLSTALREAHEEIGIKSEDVEILGSLDEVPTYTGFIITPFIGLIPYPYPLTPNEYEVAEVIRAPLSMLLDSRNFRQEIWEYEGRRQPIYFYDLGKHVVWGITGKIIKNFIDILREEQLR